MSDSCFGYGGWRNFVSFWYRVHLPIGSDGSEGSLVSQASPEASLHAAETQTEAKGDRKSPDFQSGRNWKRRLN